MKAFSFGVIKIGIKFVLSGRTVFFPGCLPLSG